MHLAHSFIAGARLVAVIMLAAVSPTPIGLRAGGGGVGDRGADVAQHIAALEAVVEAPEAPSRR